MHRAAILAAPHTTALTPLTGPSPALLLLTDGARAAAGDGLAALAAYAAARTRCDAAAAPALAAELDRRLDRLALAFRPSAGVERAGGDPGRAGDPRLDCARPAAAAAGRAAGTGARWFLPASGPPDPRRTALARALLDDLGRCRLPIDAHLRAFLLSGAHPAPPRRCWRAAWPPTPPATTRPPSSPLGVEPLLRRLLPNDGASGRHVRGREGAGPTPSGLEGLLRALALRRVLGTALAALLLGVPLLKVAGGALIWVAATLLWQEEAASVVAAGAGLAAAVRTIIVADAVMSLDNVLAVGGAARGDPWLLLAGLGLSMPLILAGGGLIAALLNRAPWLAFVGAVLLVHTGVEMVLADRLVWPHLPHAPWTAALATIALMAGVVLALRRRRAGAARAAGRRAVTP